VVSNELCFNSTNTLVSPTDELLVEHKFSPDNRTPGLFAIVFGLFWLLSFIGLCHSGVKEGFSPEKILIPFFFLSGLGNLLSGSLQLLPRYCKWSFSSEGVSHCRGLFPSLLPALGPRLSWSKLRFVGLISQAESKPSRFRKNSSDHGNSRRDLRLVFDDFPLDLPLLSMSSAAQEKIFLAISRWANPLLLTNEVLALQKEILTRNLLCTDSSYTQIWQDSLNAFEATNYVPLQGGSSLQDQNYTVLMLLACGGMSSIYLVQDKRGKRFVLKELAIGVDEGQNILVKLHEIFAREAKYLAQLNHPNIVKVIDCFVEGERDYLVLEYIPGLTLRQFVQSHGALAQKQVIEIGKQMTALLSYLHELLPPLLHRDFTPENLILREPDGAVCLIDFGTASEYVGEATGTVVGKQCYISPEQFQGQPSPASDIYALGATLYFLLVGNDPPALTQLHPGLLNQNIDQRLDLLVSKCTDLDPDQRFASARAVLDEMILFCDVAD